MLISLVKQDRRAHAKAFVKTSAGEYIINQIKECARQGAYDAVQLLLNTYRRELIRYAMFN